MTTSDSVTDIVATLLDRALLGEALDIEQVLTAHPELDSDQQEQLRSLLGKLVPDSRVQLLDADPAEDSMTEFGPFKLLEPLGSGGVGVVYLAEQRPLGRKVALKLLRQDRWASAEARARFLREAQMAASLQHENIVRVLAAGEEAGSPYLAMELLEGGSLSDALEASQREGKPIELRTILAWVRDLALALHYAHERDLIHRDVKPSNIRITPDGRALLVDFGLARNLRSHSFTRTGEFYGSPHYASPEQITARHQDIDARTDVYSLGVTLYECLTGIPPFKADTTERLFHRILRSEPTPPRRLRSDLPRDLETIVLKAMAKEPARRYASAREFADDLEALLSLRPIRARRANRLERAAMWSRRHPSAATAVSLAAILLLGGPTAFSIQQQFAMQRLQAETNAKQTALDRNVALRLAAESNLIRSTDPGLAMALAQASVERREEYAGRNALFEAANRPYPRAFVGDDPNGLRGLMIDPRSPRFVSWGKQDSTVRVWDLCTASLLSSFENEGESARWAGFLGERDELLLANDDGRIRVWSLHEGRVRPDFELRHAKHRMPAVDPQGRRFALIVEDGMVQVWDAEGLALERVLGPFDYPVNGLQFDAQGRQLLVTDRKHWIDVFELETGVPRISIHMPQEQRLRGALSPTGNQLAIDGSTIDLTLIDLLHGRDPVVIPSDSRYLPPEPYSSDGSFILSLDQDRKMRVWSTVEVGDRPVFEHEVGQTLYFSYSPTDNRLAFAGIAAPLQVIDLDREETPRVLSDRKRVAQSMRWTSDGQSLLTWKSWWTPSVTVWDMRSRTAVETLVPREAQVADALEFLADGSGLIVSQRTAGMSWCGLDGRLRFHIDHGRKSKDKPVQLSPDQNHLALMRDDEWLEVYSRQPDGLSLLQRLPAAHMASPAFDAEGRLCFVSRAPFHLLRWDPNSPSPPEVLNEGIRRPLVLQQDRRGDRILSVDDKAWTWIFDTARATPSDCTPPTAGILPLSLASSGRWLTGYPRKGTRVRYFVPVLGWKLWQIESGLEPVAEINASKSERFGAFSHDGNAIFSMQDATLYLRTVPDGQLLARLGGHNGEVTAFDHSADGRWVVTGTDRGRIHLWQMPEGRAWMSWSASSSAVHRLVFDTDAAHIAAAFADGTIQIWQPHHFLEAAKAMPTRSLTEVESHRYLTEAKTASTRHESK